MRLTRRCLGNMSKMLDFYSQFNPSPLSIKQFIDFDNARDPVLHELLVYTEEFTDRFERPGRT